MNLLAKTDQLWTMCIKEAIKRQKINDEIGVPFDYMEYANLLWKQELDRIKNQLAPKYFELEAVLQTAKIIKNKNLNSLSSKQCLLSLRPEDNAVNLHKFIYDVNLVAKKSLFLEGEWVFEQCSETKENAGKGFHAHLLMVCKNYVNVKDIVNACNFIKYNCKIQVGDKKGKKFLHTEKDLDFCRNYIRGEKYNDEKNKRVIIDKIWRKENKIEELYTK